MGLQEAKDWLNERNIEAGDELELAETIEAVSVAIINEAGREFNTTTSTASRLFSGGLRHLLEQHRQSRRTSPR